MKEKRTETIQEYVSTRNPRSKIDRSAGVIHDVKILGFESRNNRVYPVETLRRAIPLYENARVNLNHPEGNPAESRKYQDRFGLIKNVRLSPEEGLFGDFYFNPKHAIAEQLLWDAENSPENVGFSHNVQAVLSDRDGKRVVEEIHLVRSVDLVADPATTTGLFEEIQKDVLISDPTESGRKTETPGHVIQNDDMIQNDESQKAIDESTDVSASLTVEGIKSADVSSGVTAETGKTPNDLLSVTVETSEETDDDPDAWPKRNAPIAETITAPESVSLKESDVVTETFPDPLVQIDSKTSESIERETQERPRSEFRRVLADRYDLMEHLLTTIVTEGGNSAAGRSPFWNRGFIKMILEIPNSDLAKRLVTERLELIRRFGDRNEETCGDEPIQAVAGMMESRRGSIDSTEDFVRRIRK